VFASFLVLFGIKFSTKPPDKNHPYGHGRAEPLITFGVVGFLVISATLIAYESISNISSPQVIPESYTLIVLAIIIISKEVFYRITLKRGNDTNSTSLKADAWHHRSDAITSLIAFIGISISIYLGKGYETADDWAAIVASGFIMYNAFKIFKPALSEMMDAQVHGDMVSKIRSISATVEGVVGTEKCLVRKMGLSYQVDLHLEVDGNLTVRKGHEIAHRLKDELQRQMPEIADVLIHIEPS
jgi:cation diffusion facilitator family transporter